MLNACLIYLQILFQCQNLLRHLLTMICSQLSLACLLCYMEHAIFQSIPQFFIFNINFSKEFDIDHVINES